MLVHLEQGCCNAEMRLGLIRDDNLYISFRELGLHTSDYNLLNGNVLIDTEKIKDDYLEPADSAHMSCSANWFWSGAKTLFILAENMSITDGERKKQKRIEAMFCHENIALSS